jgi:putative Mg2+ transporter-C (MgtC) family protein
MVIHWGEIILRLSLAAFFGSVIGIERERKNWAAGLRTHMMVCLGAALTMIVSTYAFIDVLGNDHIMLDPSRIAAQVISGIGFIGAGTILFLRQGVIRGLTTASGLWTVAAIGLATGGGMYFAALVATILAIIILWILQPLERRITGKFRQKSLKVVTSDKLKSIDIVNMLFQDHEMGIVACSINKNDQDYVISFKLGSLPNAELMNILNALQTDKEIKEIIWNK